MMGSEYIPGIDLCHDQFTVQDDEYGLILTPAELGKRGPSTDTFNGFNVPPYQKISSGGRIVGNPWEQGPDGLAYPRTGYLPSVPLDNRVNSRFMPHGVRPEETRQNPWLRQRYPESAYPPYSPAQVNIPRTIVQPDLSAEKIQSKEDFNLGKQLHMFPQSGLPASMTIILIVLSFILIILNVIQVVQLSHRNGMYRRCRHDRDDESG